MHSKWLTATAVAALFICTPAFAADSSGVILYQPQFFAEARPSTAYDMIQRVPGFVFDGGATARGFAGTAGNVLINGQRPTTKQDSLESVLERIPASDVDHIELIRGGAPGIDMQGQTVVVNVVRKTEDSTQIVATAGDIVWTDGHMVPHGSLEFTRHANGATYEGSVSLVDNYDDSPGHGRHEIYDATGALVSRDATLSHGLGIGWSTKGAATLPMWGGEFKANLTLLTSPFVDSLEYSRPGFDELFRDSSRDNRAELGLHWKGPVGNTELETLVLQRLGTSNDVSTAFDGATFQDFRSNSDIGESIARATLRYTPFDGLMLEGGAEGAYNYLDGHTLFSVNGTAVPTPSDDARVEEKRGEVFAQGTWKINPEILFEAGARFEYSTISETGTSPKSRSFFYPKPRAVLTWSPDKEDQIRLRYERVVGQLDFNNFIASANLSSTGITSGNADLKPDQRDQFEFTYERHFWSKGALVLTYMHEAINDVVDLVPVTDSMGNTFDAPGNIGDGTNEHISMALTLPLDKIGIDGGLLTTTAIFDISSVKDPVTGQDRVISSQRPNDIHINFSQDVDSLKSTWGVFYYNCWEEESFRLTQVRKTHIPPPYIGLFWDWKPSAAWSLHVETDNVFGFIYDDRRYIYTGPRDVSPLDFIDVYRTKSRPTIDIQLRHSF
ncbi:MAG: TonB-dependent receptor [Proteobacteria bacterium]|nr:TonB-dependent receptor [Pseudomonadota bacterium]